MTIDSLFGQSHKDIARSNDFIYPGDGCRAESQGRHCLCPACLIDLCGSCHVGCCQSHRIYLSVLTGRRHHGDALHPCHLSRNNIHQDRGRICRLAAGHIYSHTLQGSHLLAQDGAVRLGVKPAVLPLLLMITADIVHGSLHDLQKARFHLFHGLINFLPGHPYTAPIQGRSVKPLCILKQRLVSPCLYIVHNGLYGLGIAVVIIGVPFQHVRQNILHGLII